MTEQKSVILIVDDRASARATLIDALEAEGYELHEAGGGPEALEKAAALMPDVILLDVMMPDMDGHEVCRRLRAAPDLAEVPVLMVTSLEDRGSRLHGLDAGADDFISMSKLIDLLNERFGTEFKPGDQLFFESIREDAVADSSLRQAALANTMENFGYVFRKALEGLFIDRMEQNEEITAKFMNEDQFREAVSRHLLKEVYEKIREEAEAANDK